MARVLVLVEGYVKDEGETVQGTVTLVQDGNVNIIVDPGMTKDPDAIIKALAKYNLTPEQISFVFISHHHPDHTIHMGLFPKAKIIDYASIYDGDKWLDTGGEYRISPKTLVVPTPGHSIEDAVLLVDDVSNMEKNKAVKMAIGHLWWYEGKIDDPVAWNQEELINSRNKIRQIVDYIVPGHGNIFKSPKDS